MIIFAKKFNVHPSPSENPPFDQEQKAVIAAILTNEKRKTLPFPTQLEVEVEFGLYANRLKQKEKNDIDNLVKLFFQCLSEWGGVWEDDCQVSKLHATRLAVQTPDDEYIAVVIRNM